MKSFTFRLSYVLTLALLVLSMGAKAQWTYTVNYMQNAGNPGGLVTTDILSGTNIIAQSQAANSWSAPQTIPFPFDFAGTPVTQWKVSGNGVVTFDLGMALPGPNDALPSAQLSPMTIAGMWDAFTAAPPTATNDYVRVTTVGTAPNRQQWIFYYSYEIGSPEVSFHYWAIVLEETTNKIYVVDQYSSTSPLLTSTVGVQIDATTATMWSSSPNTPQSGNGSGIADNDYWEFQPLLMTACAGAPTVPAISSSVPFVTNTTTNVNLSFTNTLPLISTTGLSYQWQSSLDGITYTDIVGATGLTYSGTISALTYFQCVVTCANGAASTTSNSVQVELAPPPSITLNSVTPISCTQAIDHTVSVEILVGSGTFTTVSLGYAYDGVTFTNIPMTNTTGNTYTALIPAASPSNTVVAWDITATNSYALTTTIAGSYQDTPTTGFTVAAVSTPDTICAGESIVLSAAISPMATYTDAPVSSAGDEDISNVTIINSNGDTLLNNTSAFVSLVGTVGTATGIAGRYSNFAALTNIPMVAGSTYNFSISSFDTPSFYNNSLAIFIDYNKDGDFLDAGEMVYQPPSTINGPHTRTGSFTVPSWVFGTMRMRVVCLELLITSYTSTSSWGEREDYTITVSSGATWFAASAPIGTGLSLSQAPTTSTDYTCEVMAGVCPVMSDTASVLVNALPSSPIATSSSQCGVGVPTASVASGAGAAGSGSFFWYDAATNGSIVQSPPSTPVPATSCTYTFNLVDDFGDGWNGATMQLMQGATVVATIGTSFTIGGSAVETYTLQSGLPYDLVWNTAGFYPEEVGISVVDPSGTTVYTLPVFSQSAAGTTLTTITGDCSAAPPSGVTNGAGYLTYNTSIPATTTFYVAELGTNGCFSPTVAVVATVVDPNPIILTNGLNPTYCEGATYTETATSAAVPAYDFTWTSNDPNSGLPASTAASSVSTTPVPGTYDIYVTGTNGVCTAIDTVTLTINPNPLITSATSTIAVCTGDTVQIAAESIPAVSGQAAVGTGTTANSGTTWPSPYGNWYWGAKQQFLFTASELAALNVLPGAITSVAFDVTAPSTATGFTDYTVSMGNSSVTALNLTFETGLTQVYYNANLQPSGLGYANNTLVFQTPFVWDGTSNVVLEICFNNNGYTNNAVAAYTNAFTGASHYRYADATGVCSYVDGGFLSTNRTNMQFGASVGTNFTAGLNWLWTGLGATTATTNVVEVNTTSAPTTTSYVVTATNPVTTCFSTATTNITTINILPTVLAGQDVLICSNNPTEQLTVAGAGAATYTWNNGVIDNVAFAVGATGNYIVTGTDVNGCVNVDTMLVTYSTIPVVNAGLDQAICIGDTTTLAATGLAPFSWNNSVIDGAAFVPNSTSSYIVSVLNAVGCTNTDTVQVLVNALPIVDAGVDQTICNASPVTLAGAGALSYAWDNAVTNATPFFPGSTVTYTVVGTDANGCQNQDQVIVNVLPQPIVSAGLDQTICDGTPIILNASTTSATPTAVTGFQWSNNVPNNTQYVPTNSATLTVTATGANGCQNQDQMIVTVLALPTVNAGQDITVCAGLSATLNASGAVSYAWNNGVTQGIPFYPNATQTYTVVGTGANGCTNNDQLLVTVSTGPTVNLSAPQTVCANAPATLSATVQNSLGGFWTTTNGFGVLTPNVTNSTVTYTPALNDPVVVNLNYVATNACGSASQTTTVTVLPIPVVNAGPDFSVCSGTSATLTATGNGFLTWTTPNVTNGVAFVPAATATYNVVATGFNNCTNNDQVTVTVLALPDVNAGANQTICSGESVTLNGEGAVSYQWTGGVANNVAFAPSTTATYIVTGTGVNGCENVDQVTVVVNATPVATISVVNDVTLAATPAGMNYQWINCASGTDAPNGSTANFTAIANGSYAVIVTSAEGCSDQSDCEIIDAVGLEQIANIEMSVQPNPTAGELTISMPTELSAQAQVFDAQGKLVIDNSNVSNGSILNLSNMTTGVYMVRITASNSVQTFRVVKQ